MLFVRSEVYAVATVYSTFQNDYQVHLNLKLYADGELFDEKTIWMTYANKYIGGSLTSEVCD